MPKYTVKQLAAEIKGKYPDYKDWEDAYLVNEIVNKHPEYRDWLDTNAVESVKAPEPTFMSEATAVMSGVNRGLTSPLQMLPYGSEIQGAILPKQWQAQTPIGKFASRVGEEVGAGVTGSALGSAGLGRIPSLAMQQARPTIATMMQELSTMDPIKLARLDSYISALSGAGAATAQAVAPDNYLAEVGGQLIGTFGAAGALQAVKSFWKSRTDPQNIMARIGRSFENIAEKSKTYQDTTQRIEELKARFPEIELSTVQQTNDPAYAAIERELVSRDPDYVAKVHEKYLRQNADLRKAVEQKIRIPENATPEQLREIMKYRVDLIETKVRNAYDNELENYASIMRSIGSKNAPEDNALLLRDSIKKAREATVKERRILYGAVDPQRKMRVEVDEIINAMDSVYGGIYNTTDPASIPPVLSRLKAWKKDYAISPGRSDTIMGTKRPVVVSLDDLMSLDIEINKSTRNIRSSLQPDLAELSRLEKLGAAVDTVKNRMRTDPMLRQTNPTEMERWDIAEQFFATHEAEKFREGTVLQAMQRGPTGTVEKIPTSDIIDLFFRENSRGGALESAQDLKRVFAKTGRQQVDDVIATLGGENAADAIIMDYSLNKLAAAGTDISTTTGEIIDSPWAMQKWLKNHEQALKSFPKVETRLRQIVGSASERKRIVDQFGDLIKATKDDVDKNLVGLFANTDPQSAMDKLLVSPNIKKDINRMRIASGDKWDNVRGGIKAMMYERAFQNTSQASPGMPARAPAPPEVTPDAILDFNKKYGHIMNELHTPDELKDINLIQDAYMAVARGSRGNMYIKSADDISDARRQEAVVSNFVSRGWAIARNVVGPVYTITDVSVNQLNKFLASISAKKAQAMLREAMLDPSVARTFRLLGQHGSRPAIMKRLRGHLINLGGQKDKEEYNEPNG